MPRQVLQFKIALREVEPAIWRRFQLVSTESFWGLHCAIQDAMGWRDCHLHEFRVAREGHPVRIGIPDLDAMDDSLQLASWDEKLERYFPAAVGCEYEYDFGDGWLHDVILESRLPAEARRKYPVCLGGERSCPPEDCGGAWGYQDFLKAILDVTHPEHAETLAWAGGHFDPEAFHPSTVRFSNPRSRLRVMQQV